jgi:hypothetical protein
MTNCVVVAVEATATGRFLAQAAIIDTIAAAKRAPYALPCARHLRASNSYLSLNSTAEQQRSNGRRKRSPSMSRSILWKGCLQAPNGFSILLSLVFRLSVPLAQTASSRLSSGPDTASTHFNWETDGKPTI